MSAVDLEVVGLGTHRAAVASGPAVLDVAHDGACAKGKTQAACQRRIVTIACVGDAGCGVGDLTGS